MHTENNLISGETESFLSYCSCLYKQNQTIDYCKTNQDSLDFSQRQFEEMFTQKGNGLKDE